MSEIGKGVGDIGRGFRFLNAHPRLWKWVVAPALVTLAILAGMIAAVARIAGPLVARVAGWLPEFLEGAGTWVLWIVVVIVLIAGGMMLFVSIVGIVAGPFCELLSEAVEEAATGKPGAPFALGAFLRGALAGLAHGVRRLVLSVVGMVLVFAVGFVPVIGQIAAPLLGGWLAARAAAYDCYDAVLSRRALAYRDKLAYLDRHRARTVGLGAGITGLLLVPGVNLFALGIGAAGATLAALEIE